MHRNQERDDRPAAITGNLLNKSELLRKKMNRNLAIEWAGGEVAEPSEVHVRRPCD